MGKVIQELRDSHNKNKTMTGKARRRNLTPREKAADNVRKALALVQDELAKRGMPNLAAHLKRIKKVGSNFIYSPDNPALPWQFSP